MQRVLVLILMVGPVGFAGACGDQSRPSGEAERPPTRVIAPTEPGVGGGEAPSDPGAAEIEQLVLDGKPIQAIKRYREVYGVGLKEAKDAVDAIARRRSAPK